MSKLIQLAVLGDPIAHSRSPQIHQAFARDCGLEIDYQAIQCPLGELEGQLEALHQQGYRGLNLTVPLKEKAQRLCDALLEPAIQAGAVNTLIRTPEGWQGTNTDGAGLINDFKSLSVALINTRVLILGAGGAAAGICGPLLDQQVAHITIMNRTLSRAEALSGRFTDPRMDAHPLDPAAIRPSHTPPFDLIVQASAQAHQGEMTLPHRSWLADAAQGYDLNYGPAHHPFRHWAQACEIECFDGLGMLVRQAALSFEHWTGLLPEQDSVIQRLRQELKA